MVLSHLSKITVKILLVVGRRKSIATEYYNKNARGSITVSISTMKIKSVAISRPSTMMKKYLQ